MVSCPSDRLALGASLGSEPSTMEASMHFCRPGGKVDYGSISPWRIAYRVSSTRSRIPSFSRMFARWRSTVKLAGRVQTCHPGHRDVDHGEIDVVYESALDRLGSVADLCDHGHVGLCVEDPSQSIAHDRVVVGQQYPRL